MQIQRIFAALVFSVLIVVPVVEVQSQVTQPMAAMPASPEAAIVESATGVLNEIMAVPAQGIPRALSARCARNCHCSWFAERWICDRRAARQRGRRAAR